VATAPPTARYTLAFVRLSRLISAAALAIVAGAAVYGETPQKVVSMNVCTDQLAMLVAGEGQLYSLSALAIDPRISGMVEEARAFHINSARAEEIYLMKPDLVLAGTYTARASVEMLERLGVPVLRLAPASSLADVPLRLRQIGAALGREARAAELVEAFEAGLARLAAAAPVIRPRAVGYAANGYTSGAHTLPDEMIAAAGFINIASELGIDYGGRMPLERLAMSAPDLVMSSTPYAGASRAEEVPQHPVVRAVTGGGAPVSMVSRDWACGTPLVLRAIEELVAKREALFP